MYTKWFQCILSKMCPCTQSDFNGFWVNSLVVMNWDQWKSSEFTSLMNRDYWTAPTFCNSASNVWCFSHPRSVCFYFSPSLTHKAESGTAKVRRLVIATHLNQLNHLANQLTTGVKLWAKTILLTIPGSPKGHYIWQNPLFTTHSLGHKPLFRGPTSWHVSS
jgi:hypothetical protein